MNSKFVNDSTMIYDKRIITYKWGNNAPNYDEYTETSGFIISAGTYAHNMVFFKRAAAEARRDFPKLKGKDIEVFIITRSSYNKGFAGIRFSLPENTTKRGYRQITRLNFEYVGG